MKEPVYFTYTCPVSRKTYAGHPKDGYLHVNDNDIEEAINIIHGLARKHSQPVTWVINDQEYTDCEGLLHYFQKFQSEGDAIYVTMELTTSPEDVDKNDTARVLRWIDKRCREAGIHIDGLWSLRFLESDIQAVLSLPAEDYPWTRNIAGACWHQLGIDDATWGGVPFGPYRPSRVNVRRPAQPDEDIGLVMMEWVTRDIPAILSGGFPATFTLDPADANRKDAGGFMCEKEALEYSVNLIRETAGNSLSASPVIVNINEEARHYQNEGHDKTYMLDGMFAVAGEFENARRVTYKEASEVVRQECPADKSRLFVANSVDYRRDSDVGAIYEDCDLQAGFLRSHGMMPVEVYDYEKCYPGSDGNDPYPQETLDNVTLESSKIEVRDRTLSADFTIKNTDTDRPWAICIWHEGESGETGPVSTSDNVEDVRHARHGCVVAKVRLAAGLNSINIIISGVEA